MKTGVGSELVRGAGSGGVSMRGGGDCDTVSGVI